jgi:polyvinyl alcohol dehydrogenase (cytochrome)
VERFPEGRRLPLLPCGGALLVLFVSCACGSSTPASSPPGANATLTAPSDWPMSGHDVSRTNFNSTEQTLGPATLDTLGPSWQVDLGFGTAPSGSTPIVTGGVVYVGSSVASGDNFFAFDAATGARLWSANLGYAPSSNACFGVGIGDSAAVSGSVLSVGGGDGAYYALDTSTGTVLWRHPLDVGPSGFAWSSPLIANGLVYLGVSSACDNPPVRGELRAVHLADGSLAADQFFAPAGGIGAGIWNSPALTPDGQRVVVATGEDDGDHGPYEQAVVALDAQTLAILDSRREGDGGADLDFASTPLIFNGPKGRVFAGAMQKTGLYYAFDLAHLGAGPVWQRATGALIGVMAAYDPTFGPGGTVFIPGGNQNEGASVFAVDPATGLDRWPRADIGTLTGNIAVANGLIFVNTGSDGVQILEEATGHLLQSLSPQGAGAAYSGVVVAGGGVYWISGSHLNAWSTKGTVTPP